VGATVFHSADYLPNRATAHGAARVTVVGSGQSAAEVFADLLAHRGPDQRLDWITRSRGFLPMEYSKLGLEHFTPEYTAYFHGLPEERRDALRSGQDLLYKGISADTSAAIYDALYEATVDAYDPPVGYRSACELRSLEPGPGGDGWRLGFHHLDQDVAFDHRSDVVVLATGYEPAPLPLDPATAELVERDGAGRPAIDVDYRVRLADRSRSTLFVQNGELHTHGVGAPDLGLGARRNSVIVNALAGRPVYQVPTRNVFQAFGAPAETTA
jgi:lysine N6-hydroxylase